MKPVATNSVSPSVCPLCGEGNACGMVAGTPESCWCMGVAISDDVLKMIPAEAKNKACVCAKCAAKD